jgi:glycosyltransferase involved in cell wall biosynthesis
MENKILIHADINLNIVDGATIWWSNTINVFIQGAIDIIYISNYKITNDSNLRNIENKEKLKIINPDKNLNPTETLKKIEEYGNQVKSIIVRSNLILAIINENWNLLSKTIIYGLDSHLNNIKKLNNKFKTVWTQSEKLKKLFETNGINNLKIVQVVAYKYNFNLPERKDNEIRLIYTGTLRDEENTIEIIEEFQKINKQRPEVVLKICYGKIHGDSNFINKVNTYIKNGVKGITFKYNLSHKDTCYEIATSDIGICWRKNGWGDNGEVSTKVKEYQLYNNLLINKNIKILSNIILYIVDSVDLFSQNGYVERTYYLNKNIDNTIIVLNPLLKKNSDKINNSCVLSRNKLTLLYNIQNIYKIIKLLNIKYIILPSNHNNFITIYNEFNKISNLKFIYEIRGLWYLTCESKYLYNNKKIPPFISNEIENEKKAMNLSDGLIFISYEVKEYLINELKIKINKPNIIIYNGCCINNLIKYKYPYSNEYFTIGYFGSIVEYEGIDLLINACEELIEKKYKIKLKIIGKNNMNLNIDYNFIEYTEWMKSDKLCEEYNKINLFCIPRKGYTVCNLISPLKPFDILLNKIPLLMSDCDVLKSISNNNKNCMLFKKDDINDLKNKIILIIKNGYDSKILNNGYNFVINNQNWDINSKQLLDFTTLF